MVDENVLLLSIVDKLMHANLHIWSRTDAYGTDPGLYSINIRILINCTAWNSHHRMNKNIMHSCIHYIIECIPNRRKLPLSLYISENWILCIPFCKSGDQRHFLWIRIWIYTFQTSLQYPHIFSVKEHKTHSYSDKTSGFEPFYYRAREVSRVSNWGISGSYSFTRMF